MTKEMQGQCTIEALAPEDALDAINSLPGGSLGTGTIWPAPGEGVDQFLNWALEEIALAKDAASIEEQQKHATQAVHQARKALDCLVTWYLTRDGFVHCKKPPSTAEQKSEVLRRRGIVDDLSERVLARAISVRNVAEHEFRSVGREQAEDIVELMRRTIQALIATHQPTNGLGILGSFSHGTSWNKDAISGRFYGWKEPFVVCVFHRIDPWLDIVLPNSESTALVRRLTMKQVTVDQWMGALKALESKYPGKVTSAGSAVFLDVLLAPLGLVSK